MSRGAEHWLDGPDPVATSLGMEQVLSSGQRNEDEGLYPVQHGYWLTTMRAALDGHSATSDATARG
jgi:benzoate/toluate 1,2-dioxygenase subunit alpha